MSTDTMGASNTNTATQRPGPVRISKPWLIVGLLLVCLGVAGTLFAVFRDSAAPPELVFQHFAETVKDELSIKYSDSQQLKDYFQYDVVQTQSKLSPYRGTIGFYVNGIYSEYRYDYRDGNWVCMAAQVRHPADESGAGRVEILMGNDLKQRAAAKVLLTGRRESTGD